MKKILVFMLLAGTCLYFSCNKKRSGKPRVLVFSKTAGYVHASIPKGIAAIQKLGNENNFDVDTTSNATAFNYDDSLKKLCNSHLFKHHRRCIKFRAGNRL